LSRRGDAGRAEASNASTDDASVYTRAYYARTLHQRHWFRNNRRKFATRWQAIIRMLDPAAEDVVLDVGSAGGEHALRLAPFVARVIGIDSAAEAIAFATTRAQGIPNVAFVRTDAAALDVFPAGTFDKAMAIDFVEHVGDATLDRVQREIWRVLRPGGTLAIYTPCGSHYVERMKRHGLILRQTPGHIAVRDEAQCSRAFPAPWWRIRQRFVLPSTYPAFGRIDRMLGPLPLVGRWFHFRLCLALERTSGKQ